LTFIGFGVWTLGGEPAEDGNGLSNGLKSPLLIVAVTFFPAELGDKTMLGTATLATQYPFLPVWLGSSLGVVLSDALAIGVGITLGRHLPEKALKIGDAAVFFWGGGLFCHPGIAPALGGDSQFVLAHANLIDPLGSLCQIGTTSGGAEQLPGRVLCAAVDRP
jgi:putative Ca2+/H+ antiporter (TMEM165/GDT1 family)